MKLKIKIKNEVKQKIYLLILILIIISGLLGICSSSFGAVVKSETLGELFKDDIGMLNWAEVPVHLFDTYDISLWCSEHGTDFDGWILDDGQERDQAANEAHYWAYEQKQEGVAMYISENKANYKIFKEDSPLWKYKRGGSLGLVVNHLDKYAEAAAYFPSIGCCGIGWITSKYEGDDNGVAPGGGKGPDYIKSLDNNAPGIGAPRMRSIELEAYETLYAEDHQAAAYIFTAQKIHSAKEMPMNGGYLTDAEKELGYFDVAEKQNALYSTDINIGAYSSGGDRNLGMIANKYQEFYEYLQGCANGYKDLLEAYPANTASERVEDSEQIANRIEERTHANLDKSNTDPELDDLKMYVFKDTVMQSDADNKTYLVGPYVVDYTYDDDNKDTYNSWADNEVKFNAIEKMTVYNQDGVDIEELGASFRVVYENGGESVKTKHISDEYYYDKADYKEVDGFESKEAFYVEINRGDMKPEDFTGFYIQIDFQYLDEVTLKAEITKYRAYITDYWYEKYAGAMYSWQYNGKIAIGHNSRRPSRHWHTYSSASYGIQCQTWIYELNRLRASELAQEMTAYHHDGWRHYKKCSLILTSEWEEEGQPTIKLHKVDPETGVGLYGAQFAVSIELLNGENIHYEYTIGQRADFARITDTEGYITIPSAELEAYDIYLGTYKGDVKVTFYEMVAPGGYVLDSSPHEMILTIDRGKIVGASGAKEFTEEEAIIEVENQKEGEPIIQIAKVTATDPEEGAVEAEIVEEAFFDIHVSYTEGAVYDKEKEEFTDYGELIDKKANIIRGQTKDGYLNLTVEDFANMKKGFNIKGYTGAVTLHIVEVRVKGGYSIQSDGLSVTLEYVDGYLVNYFEDTDDEVLVHYLYDDPISNIYEWAKGEGELYPYVQATVEEWVQDQLKKNEELSYDDVLAALVKYIEEDKVEIGSGLEEWKASTISLEDSVKDKNIVQIVVEDFPGLDIEIPDIEPPKPNPLLMKIGGIVFIDQDATKESENESNGKIDVGEELLSGIEVTLYETSGAKAELVQEDGEIRTNPTITNINGYYEFRGVDPLKEYYVEFRYNGMEYKNTVSNKAEYNSEEWAVTSKGSDLSGDRNKIKANYQEINGETEAFDYYEIEGIYAEATRMALEKIANNEAPDMKAIRAQIKGNHSEDPDIEAKINYIEDVEVRAAAGHSSIDGGIGSETANGVYPFYKKTLENNDAENEGEYDREYAGEDIKLLYPGQLQVHFGLVERPSTDLELVTDIVQTQVVMNGYQTVYDYYEGNSSYHQYIFEEDYNYATDADAHQGDGIAYYNDDKVHLYITYEIVVQNASNTLTRIHEIVNYYDKELIWKKEYQTPKGIIPGAMIESGGEMIPLLGVNEGEAWYDKDEENSDKYKRKIIEIVNVDAGTGVQVDGLQGKELSNGDELKIRLTYELAGDSDWNDANAQEVLKKYLCPEGEEDTRYSKSWPISNYSEIVSYNTDEAVLDVDSHPYNMKIKDFNHTLKAYQETYQAYKNSPDEQHALAVKVALTRLKKVREDDAWRVNLILTNNGYIRKLLGNAWEAIDDETPNSVHLQSEYGKDKLLEYNDSGDLALDGIKVELIELLKGEDKENGANQVVRGVTTTKDGGQYEFKSYIPGDYTVRFVYGDYDNKEDTIYSKKSTIQYEDKENAYKLPINGQYYQSTKANPETDQTQYWYKEKEYDEKGAEETSIKDITPNKRYSDAYDDAYSRLTQMNAKIEDAEDSTSSEYDYDGALEVETVRHTDPIYAYTSTMELEVEYIRPEILGNDQNTWYEYKVNNVDFGITPRSYNDVNVDKYVENIKVYTQQGLLTPEVKPLVDAYFNKDGTVDTSKTVGFEHIEPGLAEYDINGYLDGRIRLVFEEILQTQAQVEITYRITVTNDSYYDKDKTVYDQITYIFQNGKKVGVKYYDEDTEKLVAFESDKSNGNGKLREGKVFIYHNDTDDEYQSQGLKGEYRNQLKNFTNDRLKNYRLIIGFETGEREIIKSKVVRIVDFPSASLGYEATDRKGNVVNTGWEQKPFYDAYVSSREKYKNDADGKLVYGGQNELKQDTVVMAVEGNPLLEEMIPGGKKEHTLTLRQTMSPKNVDTSDTSVDLTVYDDEYANIIELSRLNNTAGKIIDVEGYDINGENEYETSKIRNPGDIDDKVGTPKYTPTLGTSKAETVVITDPTGLNIVDSVVGSNLSIVLIVLVVMAGGIVLIKKYVLVPKD